MPLARIALPRASAICLCACHKCARRVAFRLEPTTTPAQVASRRVDLRLIKEAEARGAGAPASTWDVAPTRVGKVACHTTPGDLAPVHSLSPVTIMLRRLLFTGKTHTLTLAGRSGQTSASGHKPTSITRLQMVRYSARSGHWASVCLL